MDKGRDKSTPPSASYRETFRRHRKLFCLPVILGALAAAFFVFAMGRTYKSTASLWIDTTPAAPSSLDSNSTPLAEPPSSAEQGILTELLTTSSFTSSVAEHSLLGRSLGSAAAIRANAEGQLGNGQVVQTVPGGQVLQITYSASSPAMAQSVLSALIGQLRNYTDRLTAQHAQAAVAADREQVKAAEKALATARSNIGAFKAGHPGVTPADPKYAALVAAENNAATQLTHANTALSQAPDPANDSWSIRVIDPPSQGIAATPRKSKIAEVILGGALGGLLVSFLAVVLLTPAKKEAWEDEIPIGGPFGPDVPRPGPFGAGSSNGPTAPGRSTPVPTASRQFATPSAPDEQQ